LRGSLGKFDYLEFGGKQALKTDCLIVKMHGETNHAHKNNAAFSLAITGLGFTGLVYRPHQAGRALIT